jgi:tetratricopeptide (TPR) repeat protein/O-antigen ligase
MDSVTHNERPTQTLYLLVETGLILGLAYFTFIGGAFAGIYLYGPRPISQTIIGVVIGGWLLLKFLRRQSWPDTPLDRPLLAALGAVVISSLFSVYPRLSLDSALVIFTYAVVFWFLYEQIQVDWFADLFLKCLLIVAGIVCLIAITELLRWYFGLPDSPGWPSLGLGIWPPTPPRIGGLSLGSPNHLSGYLVLLTPLALARGLPARRRAERLSLWFLGLVMLGLIAVSRSRGGLLGALGGLTALAIGSWPHLGRHWPKLRPTRRRVIALISLLIVGFAGFIVVLAAWSRVETARVRLDMWRSALQMAAQLPLFGVGSGSFGLEYLRYRDAIQFSEVFSQAHNIYLHTLATLGVVGVLASGWLVYTLVTAAWRLWRAGEDRGWGWIRLGAMAGLVGFACHGLVDAFFLEFPSVFLVIIILTTFALRPTSTHLASVRVYRWWLKPTVASLLCAAGIAAAIWSDTGFAAFDRAVSASHQGDWDATVEAIETAVQRDPSYNYYKLQLGLAYAQLAVGEPAYLAQAIAAYRAGGIDGDRYALNHANLAWLLWEAGERDAAMGEMRRAVELEPVNLNYHLNLGLMLEEMDQFEAAHLEYAQVISRAPRLLDLSFWNEGQPAARSRARLVETALVLLQTSPINDVSPLTPGQAAYYLGDWEEALAWLETSLRSSPDDPDLWLDLGRVRLALDDPAGALDAARQSLALGAPINLAFELSAEAHLALGDLDAAAADIQVVCFLSSGYTTYMLLGQLAEAQGDFDGADASYEAALGAAASGKAVNYGPWVWARPPLSTDTVPFLQRPVLAESLIEAYLRLGDVYAGQGKVSEAREAYQAVLAIYPNHAEARARLEALR